MADAENDNQDSENAGGGGKKKLITMVILALVIAGISVGGTLAALKFLSPPPPPDENSATDENAPTPPPAPAIYYPIKPEIIVNFTVRGRQRYLQAEITLLVREDDVISALELHMSKIRNNLILLIGGELYEDLLTAEGKELLRQRCLQELQQIMEQEIGKPAVEQVLFTNFVMQ